MSGILLVKKENDRTADSRRTKTEGGKEKGDYCSQ